MSKINVNRRGPTGNAGLVTLEHLRPGETFRFLRSSAGTVYQLLAVSPRMDGQGGIRNRWEFLFSNVSTGQIFGTDDVRTVVPVDCSLTARERVASRSTQRKASARSRKLVRRRSR